MKKKKDDSKPEGFHREFKYNAGFILCVGAFVVIVLGIIINHFYY